MGLWSVVLGSLCIAVLFSVTAGWYLSEKGLDVLGVLFGIGVLLVILLVILSWFLWVFKLHRPTRLSARAIVEYGRQK